MDQNPSEFFDVDVVIDQDPSELVELLIPSHLGISRNFVIFSFERRWQVIITALRRNNTSLINSNCKLLCS